MQINKYIKSIHLHIEIYISITSNIILYFNKNFKHIRMVYLLWVSCYTWSTFTIQLTSLEKLSASKFVGYRSGSVNGNALLMQLEVKR